MAKKKTINILTAGLVAVIIVSFIAIIAGATGITGGDGLFDNVFEERPEVLCAVIVDADFFSELDIQDSGCKFTGKTCRNLFATSQPFGIITDKGELEFDATDTKKFQKVSVKAEITTGGGAAFEQTLCTNSQHVTIILDNEGGVEVDRSVERIQ